MLTCSILCYFCAYILYVAMCSSASAVSGGVHKAAGAKTFVLFAASAVQKLCGAGRARCLLKRIEAVSEGVHMRRHHQT